MKKVLLAGATGYLGRFILEKLIHQETAARVIVRNPAKLPGSMHAKGLEVMAAEITRANTIKDCCKGIDTVISTVGITRQKDGLTYMDVDYQANINLLREAKKEKVRKFIYVSVLNGAKLRHLKICEAKEKFVDELRNSGLEYSVIRPNGFFSDMTEFYNMAKSGRVYLFGDGSLKSNPIHGADLAEACIESINSQELEINVGGPETMSQNEIAQAAFTALNEQPKISYIPDWLRKTVLNTARIFMSSKKYGPLEFFLTVMGIDMIAPEYGSHTLGEYYKSLTKSD